MRAETMHRALDPCDCYRCTGRVPDADESDDQELEPQAVEVRRWARGMAGDLTAQLWAGLRLEVDPDARCFTVPFHETDTGNGGVYVSCWLYVDNGPASVGSPPPHVSELVADQELPPRFGLSDLLGVLAIIALLGWMAVTIISGRS